LKINLKHIPNKNEKSEGEKSISNLSNSSFNPKIRAERPKSVSGTRSLPKFLSTTPSPITSSLRTFIKEQDKKKFSSTLHKETLSSRTNVRTDGILKPLCKK
jgi:hypothetical protein